MLCMYYHTIQKQHFISEKLNYIYIYAFSRRFYPKRLTVHSGYTFFSQYVYKKNIIVKLIINTFEQVFANRVGYFTVKIGLKNFLDITLVTL